MYIHVHVNCYLLNISVSGGKIDSNLTLDTVRHTAQPSNQLSDATDNPVTGGSVVKSSGEE